jgi:hypothetical protein
VRRQGKTRWERGNEAGEQDGAREDIFALSSRARSYYRHTWCNILPLIFASVRGFLLRPRRDFTSTHAVRDATGGSLPRRWWRRRSWRESVCVRWVGGEGGGEEGEDDRMLPKFAKSREDDTSILTSPNPAPFRFRSRTSSRSREKLTRRSGVALRARSRSWHRRRRRRAASALLSTCLHVASAPVPDIVHPCPRNNGFRTHRGKGHRAAPSFPNSSDHL